MKSVLFFLHALIMIMMNFVVTHTVYAQTWIDQNTGVSSHIFSVKAIDENTVWAGSLNGVYLRTADGGLSWTTDKVPGADSLNFYSIAAINADTAYFLGTDYKGGDSRIYKTTDGGETWTLQYQNTHPSAFFNSIAFWDENHGIAVSDPVNGSYLIVTTVNGGSTWNEVPAANIPPPLEGEFAGFCDSGGTALAVAGTGHAWFGTGYLTVSNNPIRIFRSADHGQTWTVSNTELSIDGSIHGISTMAFKDTLNGFAGSFDYGSPCNDSFLARTTDGGLTWSLVSLPVCVRFNTLVFVPHTDFQYLVATMNRNTLTLYSTDGGTTWMILSVDDFELIGLSFSGPASGWAGSYNGRILKFNGDITTEVADRKTESPQDFSLSQNYPNPFNPLTAIRFSLSGFEWVTLKIYDTSGSEVEVLVSGTMQAGSHTITFDGGDLTSGIYICRLQVGGQVETKKMVLVK